MAVHLVNPSHLSFGVGVITPRWLFVLAGATPAPYGARASPTKPSSPSICDSVQPGDVVGIGIHTGNALRGYEIGTAREGARRDGGLRRHPRHAVSRKRRTSSAARTRSSRATATWPGRSCSATRRAARCSRSTRRRVDADRFVAARWELLPAGTLHVGLGADRARLSEALLVLLGLAHRRPEAPPARHATSSSTRSWSFAGAGSGSWRWPTTTSIR